MINVLFQANCSFQCLEKTVNVHPILLTKQPMAAYAKKPTLTQLNLPQEIVTKITTKELKQLEMWANAQRDGRPAEYRWRPLFNAV